MNTDLMKNFMNRGNNKEIYFNLYKNHEVLEKFAGIEMPDKTYEGIVQFVEGYLLNELSFVKGKIDVLVRLNPESIDMTGFEGSEEISEASGLATVKYLGFSFEIPFLIIEKELEPFDVIQAGGERTIYTRENLQKAINGIENLARKKKLGKLDKDTDSAFAGTAPLTNPSTTLGFLGSTLRVRDESQGMKIDGDSTWHYASEDLDKTLEKVASIKEVTMKEMKIIEKELEKAAADKIACQFEKLANEDMVYSKDNPVDFLLELKLADFLDAGKLPHGTKIKFPVREDGEISLMNGIVLRTDVLRVAIEGDNSEKGLGKTVILSEDRRVRFLDEDEIFLAALSSDGAFNPDTVGIAKIVEQEVFLPLKIEKPLSEEEERTYPLPFVRYQDLNTAIINDKHGRSMRDDLDSPSGNIVSNKPDKLFTIRTVTVEGDKSSDISLESAAVEPVSLPFNIVREKDLDIVDGIGFARAVGKQLGCNPLIVQQLANCGRSIEKTGPSSGKEEYLITGPNTRVIRIDGILPRGFHSINQIAQLSAFGDKDEIEILRDELRKEASQVGTISIKNTDRGENLYTVEIEYTDKSKRMFKRERKVMNNISRGELAPMLSVLKFSKNQVDEIMRRTGFDNNVVYNLPDEEAAGLIMGVKPQSVAAEQTRNLANSMFQPKNLAIAATTALGTAMLGDAIGHKIHGMGNAGHKAKAEKTVEFISKFAEQNKVISAEFEKVAMAQQSKDALDFAKLFALGANFMEKTASTISGEKVYPRIVEVAEDIEFMRPYMEKRAYDLVALKYAQNKGNAQLIDNGLVQNGLYNLDRMMKLSHEIMNHRE